MSVTTMQISIEINKIFEGDIVRIMFIVVALGPVTC